jgi:hypothetical protein
MVLPEVDGPRFYLITDREILQTSPDKAQFQNGSYEFILADGGVPDVDGDLDRHTDRQEITAPVRGDPNDILSWPFDEEGIRLPFNANILVRLADNNSLRLDSAIISALALESSASLVNPYSGNSVRIVAAPGDSRLSRPYPLSDYSTQFYFTNPGTGFSARMLSI